MIARLHICFAVMIVPILAAEAFAEDSEDSSEDEYVTVVTAAGTSESELTTPQAVAVLDSGQIEKTGHGTVPDALSEAPGVLIQKTNPGGGQPIIRGLLGFHNLVLVDGVRLNNATWRSGPVQYLNTVDVWDVEKIELVKGPGSLLYGSGAMGGVIQIFTQQPQIPRDSTPYVDPLVGIKYIEAIEGVSFHYRLSAGVGPVAMQVNASIKSFGSVLGGSNAHGFTFDSGPQAGIGDGTGGKQPFTGYDEHDGGVKFAWAPAPGHKLTFNWQRSHLVDAGRADQLLTKDRVRFYDNLRDLVFLKWDMDPGSFITWSATFSYHHHDEFIDDLRLDPGWQTWHRQDRSATEVDSIGITTAGHMLFVDDVLKLSVGADFYMDLVTSSAERRSAPEDPFTERLAPFPAGSRASTLGAFALVHWYQNAVGSDGFHVWGGVRVSWFSSRADAHDDVQAVEFDVVSPLGSAGLQWIYRKIFSISAQYQQGFRAPNLAESALSGFTGSAYEIPNPSLKPERSHSFELVAKLDFDALTLRTSGYVSLLRDFIHRVPTGEIIDGIDVQRNENSAEAMVTGFEFSMNLDLPAGFYLGGQMAFAWGNTWYDGNREPVSRIPPLMGKGWLGYRHDKTGLFAELITRGASEQDRLAAKDISDARIPNGGTPGFITMDLLVGWNWTDILRVGIKLVNLFDTKYRIHGSGYYEPGFGAIAWLVLSPPRPKH